jgi:anti-anti-sigma regulatory factor
MSQSDHRDGARPASDSSERYLPFSRVATICRLGSALLREPSEQAVFEHAVQGLVEQAHYANAWILTVDHAAQLLRGRAGHGVTMTDAIVPVTFPLADPTVHRAIPVALTGEPYVATDVLEQAEREGWGEIARTFRLRSVAYLPFGPPDAPLGTLTVSMQTAMDPDEELTLMGLFAMHLTTALERLHHIQDLQAANQAQEHLLHTVRELATPAIPIYDGILVLPLVGHIDTGRAGQIMETVLTRITETHAHVVILDITAVAVIDTGVANHLIQVTQAATLLGTRCLLVGIRPEVAQTLVALGVDLRHILTLADLESGVRVALAHRGVHIVPLL